MLTAETNAIIALLLASFGIVAPVPDLAGGLFLSLACAYLVMAMTPPERRLAFWLTLGLCMVSGVIAAIVHTYFFDTWSLQLMMAAAGALSRHLAQGVIEFGHAAQDEIRDLPRRLRERIFKNGHGDD